MPLRYKLHVVRARSNGLYPGVFERRGRVPAAPFETSPNSALSRVRVLLADGSRHSRFGVADLRRMGVETTTVGDLKEAVELASSNDYDLMFIDVRSYGWRAVARAATSVRKLHSGDVAFTRVPIVVLADESWDEGSIEEAADDAIDGAVRKPLTASKVELCLRRWCSYKLIGV